MDSKENSSDTSENEIKDESQTPVDALSRTPEELEEEASAEQKERASSQEVAAPGVKQPSALKRFLKKINLYFLIFMVLLVFVGVIAIVNYLNSTKAPVEPTLQNQKLTEDTLKQLANNDASVGDTSQTLTIQGNAVIAGQTLMRGNLNVAGDIQTGGSIQGPSLTISGSSNLGEAQINNLQVASNTAVQGTTTLRDLSVSGASSFSGPVTASQLSVTRLILSGNAVLQVPNHLSFTGPSPSRSVTPSVVGSGGSASINGSDTSGTVNISTGSNTQAGCFVRVTFRQAFAGQPRVIISPVGAAAGQSQYYVDRNASGFSICTAAPAPANKSFGFDYFVAG